MSVRLDLMTRRAKRRHLPIALFTVAAAAAVFMAICPARAFAEDVVAYSVDANGVRTEYTSVSDAINAGCGDAHPTICMEKDWDLARVLEIPAGKKITIDMRGHTISFDHDKYSTNDSNLEVCKGAELTLTSSVTKEITYQGFDNTSKTVKLIDVTTTTGGLVTQKGSSKVDCWWGGIVLNRLCKLNLDGITVGGNRGRNGAGVQMVENDTLNMTNGASIEYNLGDYGGGIGTIDKNNTIKIDHSFVRKNEAVYYGGGSYLMKAGVSIDMTGGSEISDNRADAGGGVYFTYTDFELTSSDKTGVISENYADESSTAATKSHQSGGGIHVDQDQLESNKGLIENITIKDNHSDYDGGGIELDQESTVVRNCTITGNWSAYEGGGIYVCNDDNTIENCTITGNWCNGAGKTYEGGGVFVWNSYDVELKGLCTITGNTRGKDTGDPDDVFLREGTFTDAYIKGSLSKGSKVGVRTGVTSKDRMIAKNFSCPTDDCFFIDLDGYYVSYGSDHNGDAWQRRAEVEFAVTVNGEGTNRYKYKEPVSVNGASADASKVFKCWSADGSTGLYPFADCVSDATDPALSFKMPQNDVSLVAEYVTRSDATVLRVDAPAAGEGLPASGTISWKTGDGTWRQDGVAVSWLERSGDSWVPATGRAKYGTEYAAVASVAQDLDADRAFALDIDASGQQALVGGAHVGVASASVDASGRLTVRTNPVATDRPEVVGIDGLAVEVAEGTGEGDFLGLIPSAAAARTDAGTAVTLTVGTDAVDFSGILDGGRVVRPEGGTATFELPVSSSGDATVPSGMTVTLTVTVTEAPAEEVEAPEVSPAAGTYSTGDASVADRFSDGKLKVGATCATAGAEIRYALSRYEGGAWAETVPDAAWPASGLLLEPEAGGQAGYRVEVWAVKGGSESARRALTYVIDDARPAETVAVEVRWTDTGTAPEEKALGAYDAEKGGDFTFTAPSRPGYSFEKWTDASGRELGTDATLTLEKVSEATTVTAVYNPVVTALDVHLGLPEDDKELAGTAAKVEAKIAASRDYVDISGYFEQRGDGVKIEWSPSDKKASHATVYTATMEVAPFDDGVKYVFLPTAEVRVNGNGVHGGAYVVERDGEASLCVRCPTTGPAEYKSVDELETVELSYSQALAAKASQDAGDGLSGWGLPSTARVNYECGESEDYEISWGGITAFDEDATGGQELTATGTISFADRGSYVSHDGDTETVTVKVRVAAKGTVETPTASVKPGTHRGAQKVKLACATEGAAIRYTTDGSEPTEGSPAYDGEAIEVAHNATVRARAYADGMAPSGVAEFSYKIEHAVAFDAAGGSKVDSAWVVDGGKAVEPAAPTRKGYEFTGWTLDGETYDFSTPVTADLGLVATWKAKESKKDDSKKDDADKGDPGKIDGDESGGGSNASATTEAVTASTTKKAAGKELAATGDYALATVAALLTIGLAAAAAGLATRRRRQ